MVMIPLSAFDADLSGIDALSLRFPDGESLVQVTDIMFQRLPN